MPASETARESPLTVWRVRALYDHLRPLIGRDDGKSEDDAPPAGDGRSELLERTADGVRIDLTDVDKVDMAGLQLLWCAWRTARTTGLQLAINPGPGLERAAQRAFIPPFWTETST